MKFLFMGEGTSFIVSFELLAEEESLSFDLRLPSEPDSEPDAEAEAEADEADDDADEADDLAVLDFEREADDLEDLAVLDFEREADDAADDADDEADDELESELSHSPESAELENPLELLSIGSLPLLGVPRFFRRASLISWRCCSLSNLSASRKVRPPGIFRFNYI